MTLIPNLPAIVTVSGTDLLPVNDVSENQTKRITVNQLTAAVAALALIGIDALTINDVVTSITAPGSGKIKLVNLNVAGDQQYTGLPAPSNSGYIYILKLTQIGRAWFSVAIDGIGPGAPGDIDEDDTFVLSGLGARIMIVDLGTYISI